MALLTRRLFRTITSPAGIPPEYGGVLLTAVAEIDALVIGAGAAGLAAAHALSSIGLTVRLTEKARHLGDPWRRRHKNLTLNSHRDLSVLPGVKYPAKTAAFPNRMAVVALFEEFTRLHDLSIDYGTAVDRIDHVGGKWEAHAGAKLYRAGNIVVATGRDRVPYKPDWPGKSTFKGRLVHAADFGEAALYAGKSVLVAGAGNSGIDVLNHLIRVETEDLWLSARHAPAILPKRFFNLAVHKSSVRLAKLPLAMADKVVAGVQRLAFGNLAKLGLPPMAGGGASRLAQESIAIATDDGAVAAMKAGRVKVVPVIRSFDGSRVTLDDGRILEPDVVIAATGYRTGLEGLVGHLGVLDAKGLPLFNGGDSDTRYPGLWFTGMRADLRGCFVNAVEKANAIAARIAEK